MLILELALDGNAVEADKVVSPNVIPPSQNASLLMYLVCTSTNRQHNHFADI